MTTYYFTVMVVESADNEDDAREAAAESLMNESVEELAGRLELTSTENN